MDKSNKSKAIAQGFSPEYGCPNAFIQQVKAMGDDELLPILVKMFDRLVELEFVAIVGGTLAELDVARLVVAEEAIGRGLIMAKDLIDDGEDWSSHRAIIIANANGSTFAPANATIH